MITLSDDRLDLELVGFLRDEAEDLYGTPDARAIAHRIADADRSLGRRSARLFAGPMFRLAVVGMLLAAALGTALAIGVTRTGPVLNGRLVFAPWNFVDPATGAYLDYPECQSWCDDAKLGFAAWTRDGQQVAFVDTDGLAGTVQTGQPGWSVWRFDGRTRQLSLVGACPPEGACAFPSFSADGGSLAYVRSNGNFHWDNDYLYETKKLPKFTGEPVTQLVVIDLATGAERRVDPATGNMITTGWAADGRVLTAVQPGSDPNELHAVLVDPDTGAMTEPVTRWDYAPASVSPDGTTIAYLVYPTWLKRDGILRPEDNVYEVWLANTDGSALRRIHTGMPAYLSVPPTWSPDGRQLAISVLNFDVSDSNNYALDIETGAVRELPPGIPMAWIPSR
jgi:WD40-like Beta Propeller Repeat